MNEVLQKDEIIVKEVVEAAKALFQRYGLKKTTMEDIAKFVGKGKSTLYYYFPSKNEIFEAVVEYEMKELFRSIAAVADDATTARAKLKVYVINRFTKLQEMANLSQVLKEEIMGHACMIFQLKKKYLEVEINLVYEFIKFGVAQQEFKLMDDEHCDTLARVIVATFKGFEMPNLEVLDLSKNIAEHTDFLIDTFIEGIAAKK